MDLFLKENSERNAHPCCAAEVKKVILSRGFAENIASSDACYVLTLLRFFIFQGSEAINRTRLCIINIPLVGQESGSELSKAMRVNGRDDSLGYIINRRVSTRTRYRVVRYAQD